MKVLHLLDSLNRGGAEMQALDVCRNSAAAGFEMTLATAAGGTLENEFQASGVDFVKLRRRLPFDLFFAIKLRKIIVEKQIEICHGYQPVDGLHLYAAAFGLKNVKTVLSFQGGMAPNRRTRRAINFLIPRMNANLVVSRGLKKWHAENDGFDTSSFQILYNGADPERLKPTGRSLHGELGIAEDNLIVGMIGNFYPDPRKDQMTLCRALPQVFSELDNVHCIFAGAVLPGAENRFEECVNFCKTAGIADRVHFLGARKDIPDVLAAMDIFVFSSLQEGLPVAVSEAMLARVPMIVSDIEPLLEATGGGEYSLVFPVTDFKILAEKILYLLKSAELRNELSQRAYKFAMENFSIKAHLQNLKNIYQSL